MRTKYYFRLKTNVKCKYRKIIKGAIHIDDHTN